MSFKSPEKRREWMAKYQRKRRAAALQASVVALLKAGVPPSQIGKPQTLRQQLRAMLRDREALKARIEMQSGGIKGLRSQVATLEAWIATLPAMQDRELSEKIGQLTAQLLSAQQRITFLEADILVQRAEAILDDQRRELMEEEP